MYFLLLAAAAFVFSYLLYCGYIEMATTHPMPAARGILKSSIVFLSLPLGAYWWLTEGPGALFDSFRRWISHRFAPKYVSRS